MALGSFAAAFEKISLPPYTRVRWRGMVRCGALATKARNSMVVETSFADALVQWIPFLMFFFLFEKIKSSACPILFKFSGEPCYGLIYSPL